MVYADIGRCSQILHDWLITGSCSIEMRPETYIKWYKLKRFPHKNGEHETFKHEVVSPSPREHNRRSSSSYYVGGTLPNLLSLEWGYYGLSFRNT